MPQTRRQLKCPSQTTPKPAPKPRKRKTIRKASLCPSQLRSLLQSQQYPKEYRLAGSRSRPLPNPALTSFSELVDLQKLNCPICLQPLICPTLTECGHAFCLSCAQESIKYKSTCGVCRNKLFYQEFSSSSHLAKIVSNKVEGSSNEELKTGYRSRISAFEEQEDKRRISPELKEGDKVDYWSNRKWREGKVVSVQTNHAGTHYHIEPLQGSFIAEETPVSLAAESRFLASHRTYTSEERPIGNRNQFRIEIFDLGENADQSMFLSMLEGIQGRRMEFSMREEPADDSFIRFSLSFSRREE